MKYSAITAAIPVTGLLEVENIKGDTLCVSVNGKTAWSVQVIRGSGRRGLSMEIFYREVDDEVELKRVVDEFLEGNYDSFDKRNDSSSPRKWAFLSVVGSMLFMLLGLVFLAFMISFFLQLQIE